MRQKLFSAFAILMLVSAGLACSLGSSLFRSKGQRSWHLVLEIAPSASDKEATLTQIMRVIERRLDAAHVPNYKVEAQSGTDNRILVDLPKIADRERVKSLITAGGKLEFVQVISPPSPSPVQTFATREEAASFVKGQDPTTVRILSYRERDDPIATQELRTSSPAPRWVVVAVPAIVDGSELRNASAAPSVGVRDEYSIMFSLGQQGAGKFGAWTAGNINNYLGVVLNDEVKSIAYIKGQIYDSGEISGRFTKQSAEDLALVLRSGALPVPVKIVSETIDK
ncbi:MAG: preprotein translocase subunit SecD [Blastocatellia bacterium]|jgi:preprotein translocase subunit SecD|nr:preprotein translocase subunit SecD [Blastocatellia bacterium]